MYTYRLNIDGIYNIAPNNPFSCRDVGTLFSLFYINGGNGDYYQVRDVPHGDVTTTWYHSDILGSERRLSVYTPPFTIRTSSLIPFCTCYTAVAATRTLGWSLAVPPVSWIT